jgi:hypothetical protein
MWKRSPRPTSAPDRACSTLFDLPREVERPNPLIHKRCSTVLLVLLLKLKKEMRKKGSGEGSLPRLHPVISRRDFGQKSRTSRTSRTFIDIAGLLRVRLLQRSRTSRTRPADRARATMVTILRVPPTAASGRGPPACRAHALVSSAPGIPSDKSFWTCCNNSRGIGIPHEAALFD